MSTSAETTRPAAPDAVAAMRGVIPYLSVDGATKAADFYKQAFGAQQVGAMPPDEQGRTMHVYLIVNGDALMLSDFYPEHGHPKVAPKGYMLHLQVDDIETWWKRALGAGATVQTDLHDAFWGDRYGQLKDPWGVTWGIGMTQTK